MITWETLLKAELLAHGESFDDIVYNTMTPEMMRIEFDGGSGIPEGRPFTVWTKSRVYFPSCGYEGGEWVESVSRNPDGMPTEHIGRS